jgi:uncharacterized membrane protein
MPDASRSRLSVFADIAGMIRIPLLVVFTVGIGLMDSFDKASLQDPFVFAAAGLKLFSRHWLDVFADSTIQVGPLQLIFSGLIALIARWAKVDLRLPRSVVTQLVFTFGAMSISSVVMKRAGVTNGFAELTTGAAVILFSIGYRAFTSGHPSEGFIAAIWVLAAAAALDSRGWLAGSLIGLATGFKPWGLLGTPLLLLIPAGIKPLAKALVIEASAIAALYLPFIFFGEFNMQHFRWLFDPGSPLHWLYGSSIGFTWQMRVLQGLIVVGVGAVASRLLRGSVLAIWVVPLSIVAMKVLLDPVRWYWYWIPIQLLCLWGGSMVAVRPDLGRSRWLLVAALALPVILPTGGLLLAVWVLGTAAASLVYRTKLSDKGSETVPRGSYSQPTV